MRPATCSPWGCWSTTSTIRANPCTNAKTNCLSSESSQRRLWSTSLYLELYMYLFMQYIYIFACIYNCRIKSLIQQVCRQFHCVINCSFSFSVKSDRLVNSNTFLIQCLLDQAMSCCGCTCISMWFKIWILCKRRLRHISK